VRMHRQYTPAANASAGRGFAAARKRIAVMLAGILLCGIASLKAAESTALTGVVTSEAEGAMEGVLVSAKRVGGTITVTVVSNKEGRYAFPAGRLSAGLYGLSIRAVGYDMVNQNQMATVGKKNAKSDIRLQKTRDLASQLTDSEWLTSAPGTLQQKQRLFVVCTTCHTLGPILKSTYDESGWKTTLVRMWNWSQSSSINKPLLSPNREQARPGDEELARYLSSINLGSKANFDFELKTLPRPRGEDTKVIITEYDLPRADAQPHDTVSDSQGLVWYCDFAEGIVGRLNPRTGEIKEWSNPFVKPGRYGGYQDLELDPAGNPWLGRHEFNGFAMFDRKTEKFSNWSIPPEKVSPQTRTTFLAVTPQGKVWLKDDQDHKAFLFDPVTQEFKGYDQFPPGVITKNVQLRPNFPGDVSVNEPSRHNIYGINSDSAGNEYGADILGGNILKIDAVSGEATMYPTPTAHSGPRRMHFDGQGRFWIGEFYANKIAVFDTNGGEFQEWSHPIPWYGPYDVAPGKDGWVWTGAMSNDFITRFNPKTGEFRNYLLPRVGVNVRRVDVDNTGPRPIFWVGENHQAKIAKVEPLN
jgi:streptogramin lyase